MSRYIRETEPGKEEIEDYVVTSEYGRPAYQLQNMLNKSNIYYINPQKNKTDAWMSALGVQFPSATIRYGLVKKIPQSMTGVNNLKEGYSEIDKTTLGFTDERIDTLLDGGHYGSTNKNYAQAYITYMSPDDYLKLTTGYGQRALERVSQWDEQSNGEFSAEEFADNYNDVPIQLNIDEENYEVIGHEGRHRMAMLKKAGFKKVPVLVINYDNKYGKKRVPSNPHFTN